MSLLGGFMERIAFIDLGSNSVRFVISEIHDNGSYQLIYQQKESIRLSEGLSAAKRLSETAIARALRTLKGFAHIAQVMKVTNTISVSTAAVRFAKNGNDFIALVKQETGFELKVISGEEEAQLGFLGVINTIGLKDFILFDLGGASIEISLVKNRKLQNSVSLPIGALTLTEKYQKNKELTVEEYEHMIHHIKTVFHKEKWLRKCNLPLVGIGGTIRNLAKMDQRLHNYPITKIHNYEFTEDRLATLFELVKSKPLSQRKKIAGLSAERADIIIAGTAIIYILLSYVNAKCIYASGSGLREGLFYQYYKKHYPKEAKSLSNIVKHSAYNILQSSSQYEFQHVRCVSNLALMIFDDWKQLHKGTTRLRSILETAALLHDLGKQINYYSHARHSFYMIINSNLYGLSHREQVLCAFIAAFSHGINNRMLKTSPYATLLNQEDLKQLPKMSIILSLAEAIDNTHEQFVNTIKTEFTEKKVILTINLKKDVIIDSTDLLLDKLCHQFKKEYGKPLSIKWIV